MARMRRARRSVLRAGVPEETLLSAESASPYDWRALASVLDAVFVISGSSLGVSVFLTSPASELDGRAPIELLATPNGVERIIDYARLWAEQYRDARKRVPQYA